MWDNPGYYSRQIGRQRRFQLEQDRKRNLAEAQRRATRPLMRKIRAQIKISTHPSRPDETFGAWTALADVNRKIGEFFVTDKVEVGEEVALILESKETIYLRAQILRCHEFESTNRIISPTKYRYRVTVRFLYEHPDEQNVFQEYLAVAAA